MHLINGHAGTSPNGFTAAICRDVQGYYKVTHDPMKVTCQHCARLFMAVACWLEAKARGSAVMEPIVQRWFARWGHRIR